MKNKTYIVVGMIIVLVLFIEPILKSWKQLWAKEPDPLGETLQYHEENSAQNLQTMVNENYFSPAYYKQFAGAPLLTVNTANAYCATIYDAQGWFNDDESAVYGVFHQLSYKTQVSWLAERFYALYGKSLLGYLNEFMNQSELATIANICQKLKNV